MAQKKGGIADYLTEILIAGVLCVALLGYIVSNFNNMATDSTNFTAPEMALLGVIGIVVVIGVFYKLLSASGLTKK
ncbi:MAG: hypothetical protein MUO82_10800 [Candidatus Thermoplasmatota archaeon]|nr:hypothetical protein [Candidatus Thermoplasmatota archaeon]